MMGEQVGRQDRLFYEFCLDDQVPADHLLRRLDAVLDLSWLRTEMAPYYIQQNVLLRIAANIFFQRRHPRWVSSENWHIISLGSG